MIFGKYTRDVLLDAPGPSGEELFLMPNLFLLFHMPWNSKRNALLSPNIYVFARTVRRVIKMREREGEGVGAISRMWDKLSLHILYLFLPRS